MSRLNANGSNITDVVGVKAVAKLDGGQPAQWPFPTAAAAAMGQGAMVNLSGTAGGSVGLVESLVNASGWGILGFASDSRASTDSLSTSTGVWVVTPDSVFLGNVNNITTSASAQTAHSDIGQRYALRNLSGNAYVDKTLTEASNTACRVIGLYEGDDHPCFYGRVYFTVPSNKSQLYSNHEIATSGSTGTTI
jgi:hypothetical protein